MTRYTEAMTKTQNPVTVEKALLLNVFHQAEHTLNVAERAVRKAEMMLADAKETRAVAASALQAAVKLVENLP